ncbi:MAG TPA: hypothetical protein VFR34_13545, partial [Paracoccaceae bacterium]|nr:hypothetical protein [Paracoccaceae bacterium]
MGRAYSRDLRDRVQAHIDAGHGRRDAARRFGVSPSFAVKLDQHRRTGSTAPARQGRPRGRGKLAPYLAVLIGWVEAEPDITMPELAAELLAAHGVSAHRASLSRALCAAGVSYRRAIDLTRADSLERRYVMHLPDAGDGMGKALKIR